MNGIYMQSFQNTRPEDAAIFGEKAFRQAFLSQKGFSVPPGFLMCMRNTDLTEEAYSQAISLFPEVMGESVIMRSSAPGEDGQQSYAGIFDSVIFNGRSLEEFCNAADQLIRSFNREEVRKYAKRIGIRNQIEDRTVQLTSLVQRMLQPTCSGILYTMNPVTGENQIIIESTIGINALLTDGKISPDYLSYDVDGKVLNRRTGKKEKLLFLKGGTLEERKSTEKERQSFSVSDKQAYALYQTALQLQQIFSKPQDIEWAFENDQLYILQSRDITTGEEV